MRERLNQAVQQVIDHLVEGRFLDLELLTGSARLSATEMANAIRTYGRTLVHLPPEALGLVQYTELQAAPERGWAVVAPLWTREEGRSDLSLELTLIERPGGLKVEVDDIHVL